MDVIIDVSALAPLRWLFGTRLTAEGSIADGRLEATISDFHAVSLAGQIAGLGAAVTLVDPPEELLAQMRRISAKLAGLY